MQDRLQDANGTVGNRHFWAYHEIIFGPEDDDVEIVPVRQVSGHWNVLGWLEQGPCTDCFRIAGLTPTPKGTLQVFVEIRPASMCAAS